MYKMNCYKFDTSSLSSPDFLGLDSSKANRLLDGYVNTDPMGSWKSTNQVSLDLEDLES